MVWLGAGPRAESPESKARSPEPGAESRNRLIAMKVDIWSDIVCPWCYLGKRRFEKALAAFDGRGEVHIAHRSFQLDPTRPKGQT